MTDTLIEIRNLHKYFGALEVLKGIDIDVRRGERIAIIGSSGSGKSTLLRCINFMEMPTSGTIALDGVTLGTPRKGSGGTVASAERVYSERELCGVRERVGETVRERERVGDAVTCRRRAPDRPRPASLTCASCSSPDLPQSPFRPKNRLLRDRRFCQSPFICAKSSPRWSACAKPPEPPVLQSMN